MKETLICKNCGIEKGCEHHWVEKPPEKIEVSVADLIIALDKMEWALSPAQFTVDIAQALFNRLK